MLADPHGQMVKPAKGPLNLSWLFRTPPELARQARERMIHGPVRLDSETLAGWFCLGVPADLAAVEELEAGAWRKTLKIWKARPDDRIAIHNRATLHRLMYLSVETENAGGHIRKAYELYHRLASEVPGRYGLFTEWVDFELERSIYSADGDSDDEMVARSLLLISQTRGLAACEEIQEDLMLEDVDDLALHCATLVRELLPFQGVSGRPPKGFMERVVEQVELEILPPAVRLAYRLVPDSRQRRRVDTMVAELCGLLSQSLYKSGDGRQGKKWQTESSRWQSQVAAEWTEPETDHLGDEEAAKVELPPEEDKAEETGPRSLGPSWFGVHGRPTMVTAEESTQEWLEAFRIFGLPLFPLRRFSIRRLLDSGEIGRVERLPLKIGQVVWQAAVVIVLSFFFAVGFFRISPQTSAGDPPVSDAEQVDRSAEAEKVLARLKHLAQVEAKLKNAAKPEKARLEAIEKERQTLLSRLQKLESRR